ncbi:P-loop containing nucleoside triphosphate hydrolase protein [Roridomyces roridus]|uniref:P-loop containing nucleoside triphosphate hydrolase protein n=1 Tax=Roridomyces roridus TaxID=1738132 RepID=A0AAD7C804_9AGAR|nr:P-loop containing nucleoside triphosphate hydrolase protein [Roridomyces roridus]
MQRSFEIDVAGDGYDDDANETDLLINAPPPTSAPPSSSRWLLFSLLSSRQQLCLLLPAVALSLLMGGIAPFMTIVIGHAFNAFSNFHATPDKDLLTHRVGIVALQLVGLAIGSFALSSLTSYLWILTGEHNVLALRKRVYASVVAKDMTWFDTSEEDVEDQGPLGAGGLLAQFNRETAEVRAASSLATGRIIECFTTSFTCLILAFSRSPSLTLVVLSAVPVFLAVQGRLQVIAGPLIGAERTQNGVAATLVDRITTPSGISTVKAFNANAHEQRALDTVLDGLEITVRKLVAVLGCLMGFAQFVTMGLFVLGFWFGAHIVRTGSIGAGDVMAVFWACMMVVTSLQISTPQFIVLAKGNVALTSLLALVDDDLACDDVLPPPCRADILLQDVSFSYPSRASVPILQDATLAFPARTVTFIVGPSGSGKSTIGHLLSGLYAPQGGSILVDDRAINGSIRRALDVAVVGQGQACVLFDMSVYDNVALARRGKAAARREVEDVCKSVLMHEFVNGLPEGYDTILGNGGMSLSGGQAQRLQIARAMIRDPDVLVLDEATSALDPTSRVAVFEAVRRWRQGRTTIVITHDLAQIQDTDFVYVLKDGCVVESGCRLDLDGFICGVFKDLSAASPSQTPVVRSVPLPDVPALKNEHVHEQPASWHTLPFGHLFFSTIATAPQSALTRTPFSAPMVNIDFSAFHTPSMWKPLSRPDSVLARPSSLRVSHDLEREKHRGDIKVHIPPANTPDSDQSTTIWGLLREVYHTVPCKPLVLFGLVICVLSGSATPIFSSLLSRLLFEVSTGAQDKATINKYGAIVLAVAVADGLLVGLKYFLMQTRAMAWINNVRKMAFGKVLKQEKKWFDAREAGELSRVIVTDADDARELVACVVGQCFVVVTMFAVGLGWALIKGWQLALAGFAIVPVFVAVMMAQARYVASCEAENKRAREEVGAKYYETIANIRGVRAMRLEDVLQAQFDRTAEKALVVARSGAFVEGCTIGFAFGLIYLAEALLFYFGAVLVAQGTYTYLQMVEVLNLVVFTVTIGCQLMAFAHLIAKSVHATRDLNELLHLATRTDESDGFLRPRLDGAITFHDVGFSYPGRAGAPVLQNINMEIQAGECVAVVGASGSGKSTIAALLQRLYEPAYGAISIGVDTLRSTDVHHLRQHVSIVSQQPTLFDATIAENISYGNSDLSADDVRCAAEEANLHEFIMSLPQGYDTPVGENGTLISGGQAQRLQIARALARPSKVFIFDECTSALDDINQAAVLETIRQAKVGRTTVMITHKVPVMRMCDRVLVVHEGRIAEQGSYDELIQRAGVFAALVQGGEVD